MQQPKQPLGGHKPQMKPPLKHLVGPEGQARLKPNPATEKVLLTRVESLDQNDIQALIQMITHDNAGALAKLLPELLPMLQKILEYKEKQGQMPQGQGAMPPGAAGAPHPGGAMPPPPPGGAMTPPNAGPPSCAGCSGMARGGMTAMNNAGMGLRNGYTNKQIPTSSLATGGMVALARGGMAPLGLPHAAKPFTPEMPAANRFNSRTINNPKFDQGGLIGSNALAAGGMMSPPSTSCMNNSGTTGYAQGGPTGDPKIDQAMANQSMAEQAVPKESTADAEQARVSKGEFVMDAPSVMFYGMNKLVSMQEKAHEGIAKQMIKQDAQQQQNQGQQGQGGPPQGQQPPQAQPQPSNQPPPQGGPPPQQQAQPMKMPPPVNTNPPDATQQRIQADNTPHPGNPFSLMG